MSGQTMRDSAVEAAVNIGTGFIIAWLVWIYIIAPLFGYDDSLQTGFSITIIYTIASYIRSLIWRRAFNSWTIRKERRYAISLDPRDH